jgi:pimeloyl-ACP methyl ester carboxylesterase
MFLRKIISSFLIKAISLSLLAILFLLILCYRSDIPLNQLLEKYSDSSSQFIEIDGVNFHVKIKGQGTPIFLIHGSFSSLHTWEEWEKELSKSYMTISVDLPGHGLTGPDPMENYSTEDFANQLFNMADHLDIDKFHLAGNSMGGGVSLMMASSRPERILSLNLVNSSGAPKNKVSNNNSQRPWIFKLAEVPYISSILLKCTPRFLFKLNLKQVFADQDKITPSLIDRYYQLMLREGNRVATLQRLKKKSSSSVNYENIKMPVLIMWGENDNWISVNNAYTLEKVLPNSELIVFKNAGHVPMEEIPTQTVAEYLFFLGKLN